MIRSQEEIDQIRARAAEAAYADSDRVRGLGSRKAELERLAKMMEDDE
jgi:hypothetical protein